MRRFGVLALVWTIAGPAAAEETATSSFGVVNLGDFPEVLLVVYPAACGAAADGAADYRVVTKGTQAPSGACAQSWIYALERGAWTLLAPVAGQEGVEPAPPIAELEAMTPGERAGLFTGDARVVATGRQLQPTRWAVAETERVRHVHDALKLERRADGWALPSVGARYVFRDGTEEEVASTTGERPPPSGRVVKRGPPRDTLSLLGTVPRWPFLAAAGLVFVGMALRGLRRRG